jgi:hypothetical protein
VREETRPKRQTICAVCKKPIPQHERPSVKLKNGKQAHLECYSKLPDDDPRRR